MATVTIPAAAAMWALLVPPTIGNSQAIHPGGRWLATTLSRMILSGHGAARDIAVDTSAKTVTQNNLQGRQADDKIGIVGTRDGDEIVRSEDTAVSPGDRG